MNEPKSVIRRIAYKYISENPPGPLTFRAFCSTGIMRDKTYFYDMDMNKFFPNAKEGERVWVWAKYHSISEDELKMAVFCLGPTEIYCSGKRIFKSDIFKERFSENKTIVNIPLQKGYSCIVIVFTKTRAGFGGKVGPALGKINYDFLMPTPERGEQEGWIFSQPLPYGTVLDISLGMTEAETGVKWFPDQNWQAGKYQMERMYGRIDGAYAVGFTRGFFSREENSLYIKHSGGAVVIIGGREVYSARESGEAELEFKADTGMNDIIVKSFCGPTCWGYTLDIEGVRLESPCKGRSWIYLGPFDMDDDLDIENAKSMLSVPKGSCGAVYWRVDSPGTWVRPYNKNALFGHWGYPLGVTLYGLLHAVQCLGDDEIKEYVKKHIRLCCDVFPYALWDRKKYNSTTTVLHLLTSIDSLDDCGAFGAAVLEAVLCGCDLKWRDIADYIADYITDKQPRLDDGTFFRKNLLHYFHEDTMWVDDLYMCVPFLCRYYKLTGDKKFIDDAAAQFLGYKKRLFIDDVKLMSHVYDFKKMSKTGIPWGRGNGWAVFSLTELLKFIPNDHHLLPALLEMLGELCEGILAVQGKDGMWHQVLNDPDSYPETSCTAMFICAFSRAVRNGWLKCDPSSYIKAVFLAWNALCENAVDEEGNMRGVCRGSEFSFLPDYYKYELLPKDNDTHGIGIVLLAGVEVEKLKEHVK